MAEQLLAGAAMVDITPAMGIQIAGDIGRYRPVEEIREPLYARALALESAGRRCCILSLDIAFVMPRYIEQLRRHAAQHLGIEPEALMVHSVQNHASPSIGHLLVSAEYELPDELWFIRGGDDRYTPAAVAGIMAAMEQACASLRPVDAQAGRGVDGRVAFNRRFIMRDGTAVTHPGHCNPDVLYCEGPVDPEVGVMTFTMADGRPLAALLHHTCHPVHGYPMRWISGGWPGAWARGVQELGGAQCVPLVINGACGNIHHQNHLDPTYRDDYPCMGAKLTETTAKILECMEAVDGSALDWQSHKIRIPLRELDPVEMAAAEKLLSEHPEPIWLDDARTAIQWDWVYAHSRMDLQRQRTRQPYHDYEIQVIRIGETALVGWDGEPFVEAQLDVKLASAGRKLFFAHMCNGCVGYIPTAAAFKRGGYETRTGNWSKLAPEALEMISAATTEVLNNLFCATRHSRM